MKIRILLLFLSAMLMSGLHLPFLNLSYHNADLPAETTIMPLSDEVIWRVKTENGKIYKRLYNASTKTWIGDWIYVGECP